MPVGQVKRPTPVNCVRPERTDHDRPKQRHGTGMSDQPIRSRPGRNRPESPVSFAPGKIHNHAPFKQFRFSFAKPNSFATFAGLPGVERIRPFERNRAGMNETGYYGSAHKRS
jgi:hypothetical protein